MKYHNIIGFKGFQFRSKIIVNYPKAMISLTELHHMYFPRKYSRFWEIILDGGFSSLKNEQKPQKKHLCRALLFKKDLGWVPATLLQRNSGTSPFCEFCEIFKDTYFGNVCERLLLKSKIFTRVFA